MFLLLLAFIPMAFCAEYNQGSARYIFNLDSTGAHPVINSTTIAISTGFLTIIGLGVLAVMNNAVQQLNSVSSNQRRTPEQEVLSDLSDYEDALYQYEKDYEQYLKEYDEWLELYGDEKFKSNETLAVVKR